MWREELTDRPPQRAGGLQRADLDAFPSEPLPPENSWRRSEGRRQREIEALESPGSGHTEVQRPELERALRELALRELIGRPAPQLSEAMAARFMRLVVAPELYPANYFALIDLDQLGQCPPRHDRRLAEGDPHDTNSGRPKP